MKRIPPFRNRRDVFYLVHKEPTKSSENGIYIVKPKDNSYRAIWAVVWEVPIKLMSTTDGYTTEQIDIKLETLKENIKENSDLILFIEKEIESINSTKADREELANVVSGLVPMGSVKDLTELETKPKRNNDSYYVIDQKDDNGDYYIFRYDEKLSKWINTKQVVYKDVAKSGGSKKTLQEVDDEKQAKSNINYINVTSEYPLPIGDFYSFETAIRKIPLKRRLQNLILEFTIDPTGQTKRFKYLWSATADNFFYNAMNWTNIKYTDSIFYFKDASESIQYAANGIKKIAIRGKYNKDNLVLRESQNTMLEGKNRRVVTIANYNKSSDDYTPVLEAVIDYDDNYEIINNENHLIEFKEALNSKLSGYMVVNLPQLNTFNISYYNTNKDNGKIIDIIDLNPHPQATVNFGKSRDTKKGELLITEDGLTFINHHGNRAIFNVENNNIFSDKINLAFTDDIFRLIFINTFKSISIKGYYKEYKLCLYNYSTRKEEDKIVVVVLSIRDINTDKEVLSANYNIPTEYLGKVVDIPLVEVNKSGLNGFIKVDTSISSVNKLGADFNNEYFEIININDLNTTNTSELEDLKRLDDVKTIPFSKAKYGNYIIDKSKNVLNFPSPKLKLKSYVTNVETITKRTLCKTSDGLYVSAWSVASQRKELYFSTDFKTYTEAFKVGASPTGVFELGDGELLITTQFNGATIDPKDTGVWRTKNNRTEAYQVLPYLVPHTDKKGSYVVPSWGVSIYDNIVVMSEYGTRLNEGGNAGVYISKDYGKTFTKIFELANNNNYFPEWDEVKGIHIHGTCYDPYYERIWIVTGDTTETLGWSDDWGKTWDRLDLKDYDLGSKIETTQFINLIATQHNIILCTDGSTQAMFRVQRQGKEKTPIIEIAYMFNDQTNCYNFVSDYYIDKNILYIGVGYGDARIPQEDKYKKSFILATPDGIHFYKIWENKYLSEYPNRRLKMIVEDNKIIAELSDNREDATEFNTYSRYVITKPKFD